MLNQVVIMGRLTRDPEVRVTGNGVSVAAFSLAVDRDYKAKGETDRETDFVDVVAWRNTAEFIGKYFAKGRMVAVNGRLQVRRWKDKDGASRRSVEVVAESVYFADSRKSEQPGQQPGQKPGQQEPQQGATCENGGDDDGFPF